MAVAINETMLSIELFKANESKTEREKDEEHGTDSELAAAVTDEDKARKTGQRLSCDALVLTSLSKSFIETYLLIAWDERAGFLCS